MRIEIDSKRLTNFVKHLKLHEKRIDEIMIEPEGNLRGRKVAEEMNRYNMSIDMFLHGDLDMSFDDMKKILNKSWKYKRSMRLINKSELTPPSHRGYKK